MKENIPAGGVPPARQADTGAVRTYEIILESLAGIIEYRSLESGAHIRRVCELTQLLAMRLLEEPEYRNRLERLGWQLMVKAAALHDIGMIGVPENVLLKNGPLTAAEFETIKSHTSMGAGIIDRIAAEAGDSVYLAHCKDIGRHHHERWDGKGYPYGLAGEDIPISARIVAVVDVYDALVNKRCYKPAFTYDQAVGLIRQGAGTQFDPGIVAVISGIQEQFSRVEREMADPD